MVTEDKISCPHAERYLPLVERTFTDLDNEVRCLPPDMQEVFVKYYTEAGLLNPKRKSYFYYHFVPVIARSMAQMDLKRKPRILDLGCGTGTQSLLFAEQGCEVLGLDFDAPSIAVAQARADLRKTSGKPLAVSFVAADAHTISQDWVPQVDYIFSLFAFKLMNPDVSFLMKLRSVLKPGGALVVTDTNFDAWYNKLVRRRPNALKPADIDKLLKEAGFQVVYKRSQCRLPPLLVRMGLGRLDEYGESWLERFPDGNRLGVSYTFKAVRFEVSGS